MDISEFRSKYPDIYQAIAKEGETSGYEAGYKKGAEEWCEIGRAAGVDTGLDAERERIAGIQAAAFPGQDELVAGCIKDGVTVADASLKILAAYKETLSKEKANFKADGTPAIPDDAVETKTKVDKSATVEERTKVEWDASSDLRAEFGGNYDTYLAFTRNIESGNARVFGKGGK